MAGSRARLTGSNFPPVPGSYALRLLLHEPTRLQVGRFGWYDLAAGTYLYLGSAFGPGGLRARLCHHLREAEKPHWHIDFLRREAGILGGWFCDAPKRLECVWSQALTSLPGATLPVPGFGASDCKQGCRAHLVAFLAAWEEEVVETVLRASTAACEASRLVKIEYNGGTLQVEDRF